MKNKSIILLLLFTLLASCASENDSLVNPPPRFETVKVRFYNLAGDGAARTLVLESKTELQSIAVGSLSALAQPPADSVSLEIKNVSGTIELKSSQRFLFGRNITYTFVALPSPFGAQNGRAADTIIAFGTSYTLSQNRNEAYLKTLNANPDSTISYSVNLGCQNGITLTSSLYYRKFTIASIVHVGEVPISITKHRGGIDSLVGLFAFNFAEQGQYTIIIKSNNIGGEEILLLNDLDETTGALSYPTAIDERYSKIRTLNFSSAPVSIKKAPEEVIVDGTIPNFIESYKKISACNTIDKDTLFIESGGQRTASFTTSFEVLEKYSIAVFDSAGNKAAKAVVIPPARLAESLGERAVVRVLNGDYLRDGLTVSLGAREIPNAKGEDLERGFRSGETLASRIAFGKLSGYSLLNPGVLPIAVFTAAEPAKLVTAARVNIEQGKQYLIVVHTQPDGKERITIVEESAENQVLEPQPEGVFVQAVHGTAGKDFIKLEFPGLFSQAKLNYGGSLATILEAGTESVKIDGIAHSITATSEDRVILISTGTKEAQEIFDITSPPLFAESNYFVRRYINASKEINLLNAMINDSLVIMPNIQYKTRSSFEKIYREKKFSLFFQNSENGKNLTRIDDLFLTYGKTFSLIFIGDSRYAGYSLIVQQEY